MVRLPLEERQSVASLEQLLVLTPSGDSVPLSHVATLLPGTSPSTIQRIDRYRTVNITADFEKDKTNVTALQASLNTYLASLVTQYPGVTYTLEGEAVSYTHLTLPTIYSV